MRYAGPCPPADVPVTLVRTALDALWRRGMHARLSPLEREAALRLESAREALEAANCADSLGEKIIAVGA